MYLLTLKKDNAFSLGVKQGSRVVDVTAACAKFGYVRGEIPDDIHALIDAGTAALQRLSELVERALQDETVLHDEATITFGPCVTNPTKIIGVGLNYRRHAQESGHDIPPFPILFSKFNNTLAAHREPVPIPPDAAQIDYEAELAVVIGRQARNVDEESAYNYVFGYCPANDVSARDLQLLSGQWLLGKTPDKFMPLGPYLVTADDVGDPQNLNITCHINGELRQASNTADMIFTVPQIISYISRYLTLTPGDVICTGTPHGVALGMDPAPWLQPGDQMVVEVQGLGKLTNSIIAS